MSFKLKWKPGVAGNRRAKKQMTPRGAMIFGCLFCGVALLFTGIGVFQAARQQIVLGRVAEVQGMVTAKNIKTVRSSNSKGGSSTSYRPVIDYTFDYKGATYTGNHYNFMADSGRQEWAKGALAQFAVGSTYPVFVDPSDPSSSFLVRDVSFGPYFFIVFPLIHFCVGGAIALRTGLKWPKRRIWGFLAASWGVVGGTAFSHYFAVASGPYGWMPIITASVYLLATVVLLIGWQRAAQEEVGKEEEVWPRARHS